MATIEQRLQQSKIDTEKMSNEEKFMTATGMTFYNEEHEKNEWYVPGGAATAVAGDVEPEEKKEELEPQVPGQVEEEEQVNAGTQGAGEEEAPMIEESPIVEIEDQPLETEAEEIVPTTVEAEDTTVEEEDELPGSEFEVETV